MDIRQEPCRGSFVFIFTAEWDCVSGRSLKKYKKDSYGVSVAERLNMKEASRLLLEGGWKPMQAVEDITVTDDATNGWDDKKGFSSKDETHLWLYNEFLYFTAKVRPLIYNSCQINNSDQGKNNVKSFLKEIKKRNPPYLVFEKRLDPDESGENPPMLGKNGYLLLRRKKDKVKLEKDGKEVEKDHFILYHLPLTALQLRLYASGVMTLSFCCNDEINAENNCIQKADLKKEESEEKGDDWTSEINADDIAWIRDAGRRLYWPSGAGEQYYKLTNFPVFSAIRTSGGLTELCNCISLFRLDKDYNAADTCDPEDTFDRDKWNRIIGEKGLNIHEHVKHDCPLTKPEYYEWTTDIICKSCVTRIKIMRGEEKYDGGLLVIRSFNDDRMYLHSTVVSKSLPYLVKEGWTYRGKISNENKDRLGTAPWKGLKTWYAIMAADEDWADPSCQDAEMLIRKCEEATDARWLDYGTFYGLYYNTMTQLITSDEGFLSRNMNWMYYQMFLLAIMQRSSLQRFYREASGVALKRSSSVSGKLCSALKEKYVFFMNSMWFTEVTEQEQGCDFFEKLRQNMGLEEDMALLDKALEEMNSVSSRNVEDAISNALLPATFVGIILSAFDGLSHLFYNESTRWGWNSPFPALLTAVSLGIGVCVYIYYRIRKH